LNYSANALKWPRSLPWSLVTGIEQPQTQQQWFDSVATANPATTVTMTNDDDDEESRTQMQHQQKCQQQQQQLILLLPPPTTATQAIQFISILIQNVSRSGDVIILSTK